jgi:hypothetical protein
MYLNDAAEFYYAVNLLKAETTKLLEEVSSDEEKDLLGLINQNLDAVNIYDINSLFAAKYIFVCCFSGKEDLLSQWRGYCPGGNGFCIGLDFNTPLLDCIRKQEFDIYQCIYDEKEQSEVFRQFLSGAIDFFQKSNPDEPLHRRSAMALTSFEFHTQLARIAPIIKHPKFAEEEEWRLISTPISPKHPQVKFREGKSAFTPYFEIKLTEKEEDPLSIYKIWVGPTPNPYLSRSSIRSLLAAKGVAGQDSFRLDEEVVRIPIVELSEIPYRTW